MSMALVGDCGLVRKSSQNFSVETWECPRFGSIDRCPLFSRSGKKFDRWSILRRARFLFFLLGSSFYIRAHLEMAAAPYFFLLFYIWIFVHCRWLYRLVDSILRLRGLVRLGVLSSMHHVGDFYFG
jgi:hypothetical protein